MRWPVLAGSRSGPDPRDGLHVVGKPMSDDARAGIFEPAAGGGRGKPRNRIDAQLATETEIPAILRALSARFIAPVPGGDSIRSPQILPTGRNIHAFDPSACPRNLRCVTARSRLTGCLRPIPVCRARWHCALGVRQYQIRWRPDCAGPCPDGARPRFDAYGRLAVLTLCRCPSYARASTC